MKKLAIILGIVCAFAVCLVSCKEEETTGKIQGFVTNYLTNEPIQGVNISLSPTGASAVTGSDGRYEFANLQPGNYTVQGMKQGFESNTKNITIAAGYISSGDMQLRPAATGFRLNVEYLDFGSAFSDLSFKIINVISNTPMSWEIVESLNWLTATPSTGNLQGGQETTVNVSGDCHHRPFAIQRRGLDFGQRERCRQHFHHHLQCIVQRKRLGHPATKRRLARLRRDRHLDDLPSEERRFRRHHAQL